MTTEERLKQICIEQLGVDEGEITPSANFVDDLGCDSLDQIELVMAVEEVYDIDIADEDAEKVVTFTDAVELVDRYRKVRK